MTVSLRQRAVSAALLLLHVVVVGLLVPAADARLEQAAGDSVVHVEADGSQSCPPGHDHLHCQFCQHLGIRLLAAAPLHRTAAPATTPDDDKADPDPAPAVSAAYLPVGSRAPPIA
jgi:hypothetical protein